jgi:bifunctional UDP-N-acetylglucosamine pyrophosphorylase / glucosamine-1-phosphate N-acetyltransferase
VSTVRSIVVFVPAKAGIIESDVLGKRAIDHLLQNVSRFEDAETNVIVAGGAASLIRGFPNVSTRSVEELRGLDLGGRIVLLLDARFWFSYQALERLFACAQESANGLRVIVHRSDLSTGFRKVETLAVCLPFSSDRSSLFRRKRTDSVTGLEQLLDAATHGGTAICEAVQLDPRTPPLEIAGYESIAELERRLLLERAVLAMRQGVRIRDPNTVYIRGELACGANVEIEVNVILEGRVVLGDGVKIGANSVVRSSTIGERTRVNPFSIVEDSKVGCDSFVGPYGRIRPGSSIGDEAQIGNYVEIKGSQIGARSRINHHSFIGDAVLGERVTIGAGTITCNHDGIGTNRTIIERDVLIGSGCNLIAPVRIGEGATVGAGSTISQDVPARKLTLARSPQTTVENWQGPRTRRMKK